MIAAALAHGREHRDGHGQLQCAREVDHQNSQHLRYVARDEIRQRRAAQRIRDQPVGKARSLVLGSGLELFRFLDHVHDAVVPASAERLFHVYNALALFHDRPGIDGCSVIYGPQKGVTVEMRDALDADLAHFAEVTKAALGTDFAEGEGAGAAGGLGFAFLSYLKADLQPGIDLVLDAVEMEKAMEGADLVINGEGRLDEQTAMGKGPVGIAKLGKKHGAKTVALAGALKDGCEACNDAGIDAYFPIIRRIMTLDEAMDGAIAKVNMTKTAEQVFRLIKAFC